MRLWLTRIVLLQVFLSACVFSINVSAEEFNQFNLDMILAKRGDSAAQFYVAGDYEEGRGIHKDLRKAFDWYKTAAKQKHNGAQFKVGEFYEHGWGVKEDKKKALFWYKRAELNGSRRAKKYLNKLELKKQIESSVRLKKERKRRLAIEKEKKDRQRHLAVEKTKRENQARYVKARENARQKKMLMAKSLAAVSLKNRKSSGQNKTSTIANYMRILLGNEWHSKTAAAELLPSALNNCLKSSERKLVCFSHKQQVVIGGAEITFTTKSIINRFNYNGGFSVRYYFNVLDISAASSAENSLDLLGLRTEKGWQKPEQNMTCTISNRQKVKCVHKGHHFYFQP